MKQLCIKGGSPLLGEVTISGAKNSALPIMAATLMASDPVTLDRVPALSDISVMTEILTELGVSVIAEPGGRMIARVVNESGSTAPYELVKKMRGSFCVLGPLLGRRGFAKVSRPGGCSLGDRPINLHLKGLRALGSIIRQEDGYVIAEAPPGGLKGSRIYLGGGAGSTVLGTANVMSAAVFAEGVTTICHAAQEPEINDLADILNKMGARIEGAGTSTVRIEGVSSLGGCSHAIIPDRIEAGTWMAAVAAAGGDIFLRGAQVKRLDAVIDRYLEAGLEISADENGIRVRRVNRLKHVDVTALPYPGFPTDMQAQTLSALTLSDGASIVTDRIFPKRFSHVPELNRMGADVVTIPASSSAVVRPVKKLQAAHVQGSDLRGTAALVVAGLAAEGVTVLHRVYHLDRGYENIEEKLACLGVAAWREKERAPSPVRLRSSTKASRSAAAVSGEKEYPGDTARTA